MSVSVDMERHLVVTSYIPRGPVNSPQLTCFTSSLRLILISVAARVLPIATTRTAHGSGVVLDLANMEGQNS